MCLALAALSSVPAQAQNVLSQIAGLVQPNEQASAYNRWKSSIDAFNAQDKQTPPTTGAVLFVGSSTIRLWSHLHQDFSSIPVVMNRGFGGSTMNDCSLLVRDLVTRYKPRQILVYAGDNDLAEGRSPQQVLASFQAFVKVVRDELPEAQLAYISIKPSPSRVALMPKIRETNTLMAGYVGTLHNAKYIDVFTPMLDAEGNPKKELFLGDMLHMNTSGYALWQGVIGSYLTPASVQVASQVASQSVKP